MCRTNMHSFHLIFSARRKWKLVSLAFSGNFISFYENHKQSLQIKKVKFDL